jgi:hypothetical protein
MMNELKELLNKGGEKVFTRYAVEIGSTLWTALYDHTTVSGYKIESVCEDGEQKFAVVSADEKFYRIDFCVAEDETVSFEEAVELEEYTPDEEPQFDAAAVEEYAKAKEDASKGSDDEDDDDEEKCPKCGKVKSKCECEDEDDDDDKKDKKDKYVLDEIQEYVELSEKYSALEADLETANNTIKDLEAKLDELTEFKAKIDRAEKEKMIESFCMLSDEDKADVVANIDTYSLDDIEAKLSIICVRNKVSFNLEDDDKNKGASTTFNLNDGMGDNAPAWVKALRAVAKDM